MRLIRPASLDDLTLTLDSTNVAETNPVYNAGTTYALDAIVRSDTTHHDYQSLQASNTGHSLSDAAWWLDLGPTNPYKMFDNSNTSQTENAETIEVVVTVDGRADAIAFLNMVAASITIVMTTVEDGELVNETIDLVTDSGINNWFEYFFEPVSRLGDYVRYDLPNNLNPTFTITITDPGATAKIGSLIVGQSRDLGNLLYGARIGITDYSRKEQDDFGNYTIIERPFAKRASLKAVIPNTRVDAITTVLAQYRATACVIIGHDLYASTFIYGFYKGWEVELAFLEQSYLTIEWEGLT